MILKNRFLLPGAAICFTLAISACAQQAGESDEPADSSGATSQPSASTASIEPATSSKPKLMTFNEQMAFALEDLSKRLDMPKEDITFSGARPVNWRSGALGCPEPGMMYTQALVPGALIFFRVGNDVHGYHAREGGEPFYCPRDRAEQPVFGQGADMT